MRLIDTDLLEPDADFDDGEFWAYSKTQIENASNIEPLTVNEKRIFLEAMSRERLICQSIDTIGAGETNLVEICNVITRKVKATLW